jgi:hypothetical protein
MFHVSIFIYTLLHIGQNWLCDAIPLIQMIMQQVTTASNIHATEHEESSAAAAVAAQPVPLNSRAFTHVYRQHHKTCQFKCSVNQRLNFY